MGRDAADTYDAAGVLELTGWSDERKRGWLDACAGRPAASSAAIPEDCFSDHLEDDPALRYALGWRDGLRSLEPIPPTGTWLPGEAAAFAACWQSAACSRPEGDFPAAEADWRVDDAFDVARLVPLFGSVDEARAFVRSECAMAMEDGREGYGDLLTQEIREHVCVVELEDGTVDLWDGWHRSAAAIAKGAPTIRAVVGVRRPELAAALRR